MNKVVGGFFHSKIKRGSNCEQNFVSILWDKLCKDLLENHLEGAVVECVSAHHPHDFLLHYGFVGSSGERWAEGLDAW